MKTLTNIELAQLLRKMAASYQMLGENRFKIIAYERAADSIEHLTSEAKDYWDDGKLGDIPSVGAGIAYYLDELFRSGHARHFDDVMKRIPEAVFPLLLIPGIGPKKAYRLVKEFGFGSSKTVVSELEAAARDGKIASMEGFGDKSEDVILSSIALYKKGAIKENRMELPLADTIAQDVMTYLMKLKEVEAIDVLGSLRRHVATIGDIDIAAATKKPELVIAHFVQYPHEKLIDEGPRGASILLHSGRQVDLRVSDPRSYGAMLQYFTGSKNHNIKLRSYALEQGLSLSEHGIKYMGKIQNSKLKGQNYNAKLKTYQFDTEESFYKAIGLPWIAPELREDKGEIDFALRGSLPNLVELSDIRGDLHIHTNYDLSSSHDLGADPLTVYLDRAMELGYAYIGISDHNPSVTKHSVSQIVDIMKRRKGYYEHQYSSWTQKVSKNKSTDRHPELFIMCEVDIQPDGALALPEKAFDYVDAVVVSIHSSFTQSKDVMTKRVITALIAHPKVRIFGHPTGRLLTKREGVEIDWNEIFTVCKDRNIALEINAHPQRLDLPDTIVYDARKEGIRFCINTDSHAVSQMDMMRYGVSVARRGWCQKDDIINSLEYTEFRKWLKRS
ncbi:MAG: helix-hairpin-helix domain-containing protein [Candidatus Gottesmanbacteria bacterium]|nr:helix-hairpin-helix domain-containing protein [Candidatus Gottesmanbacteria bacterium]